MGLKAEFGWNIGVEGGPCWSFGLNTLFTFPGLLKIWLEAGIDSGCCGEETNMGFI